MKDSLKVAFLAFVCFATSISEFAIVGTLDVVAASLGVSVSMAGQLLTAFSLSGGIGVPLAVIALSRLDRRVVMAASLASVALGCLLVSLTSSFALIVAARVLMAIGSGVFTVCSFAAAPGLARKGREASAIATVTLGFNAALVLGLPFGRLLVGILPWTAVFWFVGIASAVLVPVVLAIIPPQSAAARRPVPLSRQLAVLKRPELLAVFALTLFWTAGYAMMYAYITPYLQETSALEGSALSGALLAYGLSTLVGNKVGGALADRFGARRAIVPALLVQAAMLAALFALRGPAWLVVASILLWGVCAWIPAPAINVAVIRASGETPDTALSLKNSVTQLAYAIGSGLGGAVIAVGATHGLCLAAMAPVAAAAVSAVYAARGDEGVRGTPAVVAESA